MIIIVEGIDRVGKTTLCNTLSEQLNIPIFKKERTADNNNDIFYAYDKAIINLGNATGLIDCWNSSHFDTDLIVDRFYWTEYVYTRTERYSGIPLAFAEIIENQMMQNKDDYIIVYVEPTDIKYSSDAHGYDLSRHDKIFNMLYDSCQLTKIKVNYNTLEDAVTFIKEKMSERQ